MGKTSNSMEDLHAAARAGDVVAVQTICSSNPLSVNSRDKHSRTPLHLAAWAGQTQVVNILCKNKADVGAAAMDDMGAIHFAAQKGHLEVVRTLVSSGVSIKSLNRKGMTALHYAVQGSYLDLIKYLVKKGANVSIKNKAGKSPLDLASNEEIRLLLSCPSESKERDVNGSEDGQPGAVSEGQTKDSRNEDDVDRNENVGQSKDESAKRKPEDDVTNAAMAGTKKTKVALNHLLTSDDAQEEEEL
ncbi:ankyrin repeat domain-containing protein 6 [Cynara cardunculus var. scolymus]|uniref:Ankyrin repeat-containing protein n=1 Tax=Cynara cardunculus var. scolymus TaxID=59895 RepID=A0A103XFQ8_CYNCS|nr:ankyrin repeat domain-containing protein 6 [Cynara cardunculus var. scolymus]KVH89868.1 Ankyrin repeat-containing protein [Cynara cardunculus var. scolymus]